MSGGDWIERRGGAAQPPSQVEVDTDLVDILSSTRLPKRLRERAKQLGVGSSMSTPDILLQDLINLYEGTKDLFHVQGPATATLLGGSVSAAGELHASGIAFSVSGGVRFVTVALPAALLVPGGGFYVAYRLYEFVRDVAAIRSYTRVSQAAPHIAVAVAGSDHQLTRDEARLLRDLIRARVGTPAARRALLLEELDLSSQRDAALDALRNLEIEPEDWPVLLSIAVATAHADDEYSGEERAAINELRSLTRFSTTQFGQMAAEAEADYLLRCHLGEAMVRACYQIACGGAQDLPQDAHTLMDILLFGAVPSDTERAALVASLDGSGRSALPREELVRGTSDVRPSIFRRIAGERSEADERLMQFGETMALFLATLEQWRGWVVKECREQLYEIGRGYGLETRHLDGALENAHRNVEGLRPEWLRPHPWAPIETGEFDIGTQSDLVVVTRES